MDEIIVNQTKYISSKRASAETGYAKDYVGQLVRQGKIDARKVGRSWYVNENQILQHSGKIEQRDQIKMDGSGPNVNTPTISTKQKISHPHQIESVIRKSWSDIKYYSDNRDILPISDRRDTDGLSEMSIFKANEANVRTVIEQHARISSNAVVGSAKVFVQPRAVDGIQPQPGNAISVSNRQVGVLKKYVDAEDFSAQWRYRSFLTILVAAAISFLMPIVL